jgi:hypothetical protein
MKIFLPFDQAKTSQLDKQFTCFGQRQCAWQPVSILALLTLLVTLGFCLQGKLLRFMAMAWFLNTDPENKTENNIK